MSAALRNALALALGLGLSQAALAGGNAEAGKAKAAQVCAACHSADGSKPTSPQYPVLAGQYYDYLVRVLKDYKSGKRSNPIMKGFASTLSEQDMEDVAAWFSAQPSRLYTPQEEEIR
ncbi:MAG TPA: cytochrome c [Burkholderiales bacterium]|nr:cytochrome c [Burkholderiales bacterium]